MLPIKSMDRRVPSPHTTQKNQGESPGSDIINRLARSKFPPPLNQNQQKPEQNPTPSPATSTLQLSPAALLIQHLSQQLSQSISQQSTQHTATNPQSLNLEQQTQHVLSQQQTPAQLASQATLFVPIALTLQAATQVLQGQTLSLSEHSPAERTGQPIQTDLVPTQTPDSEHRPKHSEAQQTPTGSEQNVQDEAFITVNAQVIAFSLSHCTQGKITLKLPAEILKYHLPDASPMTQINISETLEIFYQEQGPFEFNSSFYCRLSTSLTGAPTEIKIQLQQTSHQAMNEEQKRLCQIAWQQHDFIQSITVYKKEHQFNLSIDPDARAFILQNKIQQHITDQKDEAPKQPRQHIDLHA